MFTLISMFCFVPLATGLNACREESSHKKTALNYTLFLNSETKRIVKML